VDANDALSKARQSTSGNPAGVSPWLMARIARSERV
jgi:hypothetical protein